MQQSPRIPTFTAPTFYITERQPLSRGAILLAIVAAVAMLTWYFERLEKYVTFNSEQWRPQLVYWKLQASDWWDETRQAKNAEKLRT